MIRTILSLGLAVLIAACAAGEPRVWSEKDADAELERAEQLFADGSYRRAALAWEQAALTRPLDADRLYILAAEAWLQGMNPEQAEKALSQIDPAVLDGHDLTRLDLAQAELAMLHEDFANAGWLLASVSDHLPRDLGSRDRKSTRLNSSHVAISYAVFCLKKKNTLSYRALLMHPV